MSIFAIDFSKGCDSMKHFIPLKKCKELPFNPYVIDWVITFSGGLDNSV